MRLDKPKPDGRGGLIYNIPVNCGKCLNCKRNRVNKWSFRLMEELKVSYNPKFVTLTYDTEYVPITEKGFMTLRKNELQSFFKRLRYYEKQRRIISSDQLGIVTSGGNLYPDYPIKYYAVGEYGTKRKRPHYHIIIFNVVNTDNIYSAWTFGGIHIDEVNNNTIDYTLKYIMKFNGGHNFKAFDGEKEFSLMSKHLGKSWLSKEVVDYYRKNLDVNYMVVSKGYKIPMSKYYRDKMLSDKEKNEQLGIIKREVEKQDAKISEKALALGKRSRYIELQRSQDRPVD